MQSALIKSGCLVFLIVLGNVLKQVGLFKKEDSELLAKIMLYITMPAAMVNAFRTFRPDIALLTFFVLGIATNAVLLFAGWLFGRKEKPLVHAMYMTCIPGFNIGSFGIPFVQTLFPAQMIELVMFDIGNTIMNCGLNYSVASLQLDRSRKLNLWQLLKSLMKTLSRTFPFILYLTLLTLTLLRIQIPDAVYQLAELIAGGNAVVVMLMLGIMFEVKLNREELREVKIMVFGRVGVQLLLTVLTLAFLPLPMEQRVIAAVATCTPIGSMATVFCGKMGCDQSVYGTAASLTIPVSVVIMVVLALL